MSAPATPAPVKPPFRMPSLDEHWRDLRSRPTAWLAIGRNLVPVVGVFALGWSRSLVVFDFWFDGLTGLAAILTAVTPRAVRESAAASDNVVKRLVMGVVAWVFLVGIVCLPYWIVLIPLHGYILDPEMWRQIRSSPGLWAIFGGIALTHAITVARKGYAALPEREMKQALRWDAYLLVLRAIGMFSLAAHLPMVLMVPALALFATYLELWPANALGAVWGDPKRLHEDPHKMQGDAPAGGTGEPGGQRKRRRRGRR